MREGWREGGNPSFARPPLIPSPPLPAPPLNARGCSKTDVSTSNILLLNPQNIRQHFTCKIAQFSVIVLILFCYLCGRAYRQNIMMHSILFTNRLLVVKCAYFLAKINVDHRCEIWPQIWAYTLYRAPRPWYKSSNIYHCID